MSLSEKIIIDCWEKCYNKHPLEASLILLNSAIPSRSKKEFADMNIGQRNLFLFHIREKLFGNEMNILTFCPNCNTKLESTLSFDETILPEESVTHFFTFSSDGYKIIYKLPDSYDLASASKCYDVFSARNEILNRCITESFKDDKVIPVSALTEEIILKLSKEMSDKNPYAETLLNLTCQHCSYSWTEMLDIASFILNEINFFAQNILRDIHLLASAYHWTEFEILKMSARKRTWYINQIGT